MTSFLLRRMLAGLVLLFVIVSVTFWLTALTDTNPAADLLGQNATSAQLAAKTAELGLDRSVSERYVSWLGHALTGDLGTSWTNSAPVLTTLGQRLPVTLSVVLASFVLSSLASVALGMTAAVRRGWIDRVVQVLGVVGFAAPGFVVALLLSLLFAVNLGWFPATGYVPFAQSPSGWLSSLALPAVALALAAMAASSQQVRGALIDVLGNDYVRTLRSRGLGERSVLFKHALRNAAPPALTVMSLQFISMVGGSVVIEKVFGLNGIGSMANDAAVSGDVPSVLGVVVAMVALVVLVNLLIDVTYGWLNPKVRVA